MSSTVISSTNFQSIFNAALDSYAKQTGIDLTKHPSADKLNSCTTSEDVLQLLQDRETAFKDYRDKHRKLINCLRPVVQVVHAFSGVLAEVAGFVPFQPTNLIFAGVDLLLAAATGVSASYDALVDLFDCIGNFLARLRIYAEKIPLAQTMLGILVKIMAEVIGVLAVVTRQIKQGRFTKFSKKLLGEGEIEAILQMLDRLSHEEARMTAAHTLEVVHGLVNNLKVVMDDGKASSEGIRRALVGIQELADEIHKMKRDQLQEKIRNWLLHPDPSTNHNIALEQHHDGTAEWFVQGSIFKEWREVGSLLWIHGKPGSGKSILCSSIIQDVEALHNAGLALMTYFYCDFRDQKKQDVRYILSSLLAQLSAKSDPCYEILSALYSNYDAGSRQPSKDALTKCLENILGMGGQPPIYIIIDAVDECPNTSTSDVMSPRDRVLELVEKLLALHLSNLRICVTSRPEADILASLNPLAFRSISLHDQSGQKDDITKYVRSVVHTDRRFRKWRLEDKNLVIETLSQKAGGMFRWIVCQLAMLRDCLPARIQRALDDLPRSLDDTYERILRGITQERRDYAQRLFQCLAVSIQPLRVDELAEILAIRFDDGELPIYDATLRPEDSEEAVLSTCSSLITIVNVSGSPVVQFSHFSVTEYLTSKRLSNSGNELSRYHINPESAHTILAQASLSILLSLGDQIDKDRMKDFPLAIYAARHWVNHAHVENVSLNLEKAMELLFDSTNSHFASWTWIYDVDYPFRDVLFTDYPTPPEATPLYYATLCGFRGIVERLIVTCPQDINARGGYYSTPLHAALANSNLDIAQVLLEHHADVTASNNDGLTPLLWASRRGHLDCVKLLLEYDADLYVQDGEGQSPLTVASRYGQLGVVRLLLQNGAVVDFRGKSGFTPLMSASRFGYIDIVCLLLQNGAAVDFRGKDSFTPLIMASLPGHLDVVRVLLENGAAVDLRNNHAWTPLKIASQYGYLDIARLLIQSGAPVDSHGEGGLIASDDLVAQTVVQATPLHIASALGRTDVAELLINYGADCENRDRSQKTSLIIASEFGQFEIARLLLESGSNPNSQDGEGWTALHRAARSGHLQIAKLLVESGAEVNIRNVNNATAFDVASGTGKREVAGFLAGSIGSVDFQGALETTDVDTVPEDTVSPEAAKSDQGDEGGARTDHEGEISLHIASEEGNLATVQALLDGGARVDQRDTSHKTPLDRASSHGRFEVAKLLIKNGANVNSRDKFGSTPLHKASQSGHLDVARLLLDDGADVNVAKQDKYTPLHVASSNYHLNIVHLLLERGANVHARNEEGMTAYTIASRRSQREIMQLLLEYGALAI